MFVFLSTLLLCVITWNAEGAIRFTQTPNSTVYFLEEKEGVLDWKYSLGDNAAEFDYIAWYVKKGGKTSTLFYENATGFLAPGNTVPAEYIGRVSKTKQATVVIRNINFNDSAIVLRCSLLLKTLPQVDSEVTVVVTGQASLLHPTQVASKGGSVDYTCNAIAVPSFSWSKYHGETQSVLANNQNVTIVSKIGSSILKLKNVADYSRGYYICDATANVDQPNVVKGYLQLLEPFKQDDTYSPGRPFFTAINESLTFCCPVNGYPPPTVTWGKNGTNLQTGENKCYNTASVKNDDFGNYTCVATDGITTIGPFVFSLLKKEKEEPAELSLTSFDGSLEEPAKLEWEPLPGATYYVVNVDGSDINGDAVIGSRPSIEIHYSTLVMVNKNDPPIETEICAGVTAFSSEAGVIGKSTKCEKLMVKKPADVFN
ncbi:opioid-binding protein/cell adhesion molecule-like [Montipora foliosa]|uniref:opioid-binding protein/cell adhesion molecule-like n=1 Tax=Montipora foliosa TaxID=591990 RepID=UPI0035F1C50E